MSLSDKAISYLSRAAGDRSHRATLIASIALLIFFSALFGLILLFYNLGLWLRLPLIPIALRYAVGPPLLIVGCLGMFGSVGQFVRVKGTPVPLRPPPNLVTHGLYRFVRNPMFGGLFLFITGLGFWLRSILLGCALAPLLCVVYGTYLTAVEEPELEKRFGREYVEYRKRTPRFVPRLKKSSS